MSLTIDKVEHESVGILVLVGEVDSRSAGELESALVEEVKGGRTSLLLDCADLEFISSAGLRILVMMGKRVGAEGGRLALARVDASVRRVLDVAGMTQLFAIHPGRDEAIHFLEKSSRMAEVSSLAGSLLKGQDEDAGEPGRRFGGDRERSALAADLLRRRDESDDD